MTGEYSADTYFGPFCLMPIPVHSMGPDGKLIAVNDAWIEFTGYDRNMAVGHSFGEFLEATSAARYHGAAVPEMIETVAVDASRSVEYQLIKRSGEIAHVVLTARPERDIDGRFLHSLAVLSDITARNRSETASRQSQKLEALGSLTGGVAHDFNNLLTIILGSLQLLQKRLSTTDPRTTRLLDAAMQGAERGAALTSRLLAFARKQELSPKTIDPGQLLRSIGGMLLRTLGPTIHIQQDLPGDLWNICADQNQLELALVNLAVNARDAMPEGGLLLITACNVSIAATSTVFFSSSAQPSPAHGDYVAIRIRDHGTGMDAATLARAADPFFTTKGPGKGTGLGLSMVHGFVTQSGGALQLSSQPGEGTTVELWLPRSTAEVVEPFVQPVSSVTATTSSLVILLVDDDPLVLSGTAGMLEELGHHVACAVSSGAEALTMLRGAQKFDLLFTDNLMPGMTGLQLAHEAQRLRPGLAVLVASGFTENDAMEPHGWLRLRKPYSFDDLAKALATFS
jgi:PAS domain S-box-containing protein